MSQPLRFIVIAVPAVSLVIVAYAWYKMRLAERIINIYQELVHIGVASFKAAYPKIDPATGQLLVADSLQHLPRLAKLHERAEHLLRSQPQGLFLIHQSIDAVNEVVIEHNKAATQLGLELRSVDIGLYREGKLSDIRIRERDANIKQDLQSEIPRHIRAMARERLEQNNKNLRRAMDSLDNLTSALVALSEDARKNLEAAGIVRNLINVRAEFNDVANNIGMDPVYQQNQIEKMVGIAYDVALKRAVNNG